MAKVLIYAHDPGGANALSPLIIPLRCRGHQVMVFGKGPALTILPDVHVADVAAGELIANTLPDFVFTGTSAADIFEKQLRRIATLRNIHSASILDHWVNYGIRFSHYSTFEIDQYNKNPVFDCLPEYIIVMDEFAKNEMASEGVPAEMIYPLGNPHFDTLRRKYETINPSHIKGMIGCENKKFVVFASEPYIEDYGYGDELVALADLASILPGNCILGIKPHPREHADKFKGMGGYVLSKNVSSLEAIKVADIVVSMTSMVLVEAAICGHAGISYIPGGLSQDKFILRKRNVGYNVSDLKSLRDVMRRALDGEKSASSLHLNFGATERIINFMEEKICQN